MNQWFFPSGEFGSYDDGSIPDQLFFLILMISGCFVLARRHSRLSEIIAQNSFLMILFAFIALSVTWSADLSVSSRRFIRICGDLIMVFVVLTEVRPLAAIEGLFRSTFCLLVPLSLVLIKWFPHLGKTPAKHWAPDMWVGVSTHKNTLGQLCLIATIYYAWDLVRKREKRFLIINSIYLIMLAYLLNGGGSSRSSTSILLIIISAIVYFLVEYYNSKPYMLGQSLFIFFIGFFIIFAFSQVVLESSFVKLIAESSGRDATLSGRTDLWRDLIPLGIRNLFFGSGFGGFWTINVMQQLKEIHTWGPAQSHNGYIEIFLHLGLFGLIIFLFTTFSAVTGSIKQCALEIRYGQLRIVLLVVALLHNFTESSFIRPTHLIWVTFLIAAINSLSASSSSFESRSE